MSHIFRDSGGGGSRDSAGGGTLWVVGMQQRRCELGITPSESNETEHPGTGYMKQISYFRIDREEQHKTRTHCQSFPKLQKATGWVDLHLHMPHLH